MAKRKLSARRLPAQRDSRPLLSGFFGLSLDFFYYGVGLRVDLLDKGILCIGCSLNCGFLGLLGGLRCGLLDLLDSLVRNFLAELGRLLFGNTDQVRFFRREPEQFQVELVEAVDEGVVARFAQSAGYRQDMQDGEEDEADNPALACAENSAENPVHLAYGSVGDSLLHKVANHEQRDERDEEPEADADERDCETADFEVARDGLGEQVVREVGTCECGRPCDKPKEVLQETAPDAD